MKRFLLTVIFLEIIAASYHLSYAFEQQAIRVGAFNNYPGIFMDNDGVVKGIYVDVLTEIGLKENIKFEYVYGSWSDALERIKTGEVDLLTSVAKTPERELFLDFSRYPLLTTWGELYTLKTSEIDEILEVDGKKIAVVKNDFNAKQFINLVGKFGLKCDFHEFNGSEDVFMAVSESKVDAGVVSSTYGAAMMHEFGLRSTGVVFNPFDIYFATSKGKNEILLRVLDRYLDNWKHHENSAMNMAKQKWLRGFAGREFVIPAWFYNVLAGSGAALVLALIFIIVLKLKVTSASKRMQQKDEAFREVETRLHSISKNIQSGMIYQVVVNNDGMRKFTYVSDSSRVLWGASPAEIMENPDLVYSKVCKDDIERLAAEEEYAIKNLSTFRTELRINSPAGLRWSSFVSIPRFLADGRLCFDGIQYDITEQKLVQEKISNLLAEKELLLREVHHRIKNNMNTIKGLLSLQLSAESNPSTAASLRDAESRVQSMILLYDRLYCTDNYREMPVKDYLQSLAEEIIGSFPNRGIVKIESDIEDFILNVNILSPLGIIINELLTNMMKYAFTGRESGIISITAGVINNMVRISICDNGVGIPDSVDFENHKGFGLDLVKMLIDQIGGVIRIERGAGTRFNLEFNMRITE